MTPELKKIVERVQKLLNLAGNNPNENEAAAAVEKAYAVLAEHNLTLAEVQAHGAKESDAKRESLNTETNFSEIYYRQIWLAVAKANFCSMFSHRPSNKKRRTIYTMVGRDVNVIVATQLAMYLCQTVRRISGNAAREATRADHAFKNGFIAGCAWRLVQRVADMNAKQATGNALVLWSGNEEAANREYIQKTMGVKLVTRKAKVTKLDRDGFNQGTTAADKISLAQQVGRRPEPTRPALR